MANASADDETKMVTLQVPLALARLLAELRERVAACEGAEDLPMEYRAYAAPLERTVAARATLGPRATVPLWLVVGIALQAMSARMKQHAAVARD